MLSCLGARNKEIKLVDYMREKNRELNNLILTFRPEKTLGLTVLLIPTTNKTMAQYNSFIALQPQKGDKNFSHSGRQEQTFIQNILIL